MAVGNMVDISSGVPRTRRKRHTAVIIIIIAVIALLAAGGVFGKQLYEQYQHQEQVNSVIEVNTFYPGIVVQGIDLGGKTMEEAAAAVKQLEPSLRGKYDITIKYKDKTWKLTEDDLAFAFDTDSVLKEAYAYGREGDPEERYQKITALRTMPKTYQISNMMNYDGIDAKLKDMIKDIPYSPVDATVASFDTATTAFQYADGKDGLAVDENKLYSSVESVINGAKTGTVEVPTTVVPFNKSIAEVKSHLQKLGTYSTTSTNTANGTYNMARALASINGTCVPAGATFSFNETAGDCNKANGYREAGAILNGKLIQAYGGGICQASTTIYGAALRSNMAIVQRSNHSIQSTYCPIGQDAAVSYPELDFKFKNPTEYPIYIVTSTKGKVMTATFYGYQSPDYDKIEITSKKTESVPAPADPKYTVDNTLAKGAVKLDAKARVGSRATAQRVFYKDGKVVKTENLSSSYYRASPAFYSIGPGTNVGGKPATSSSSSSPSASKPSSSSPAPSSSAPKASSSSATPQSQLSSQTSSQAASQPDAGSNPEDTDNIVIPE